MRDNGAKENDIISSFWEQLDKANVADEDTRIVISRAVTTLGLPNNGILLERVGSHSFRAGRGGQWRSSSWGWIVMSSRRWGGGAQIIFQFTSTIR